MGSNEKNLKSFEDFIVKMLHDVITHNTHS